MQNDFRQFYIFDLEVGTRKNGAILPTMLDIIQIFQSLTASGHTYPIRANTGTMLFGDISIDANQNLATLLVRLSDKMAPNAVYSDPATGQFNVLRKQGNQGADLGCHVIISTQPERGKPNVYTCAIERMPGLPSSLVERLLSKFLHIEYTNNQASFTYPHPAGGRTAQGTPRVERCRPHIELRGRPSSTLINDINNGTITGISLIKDEPVTPIGGATYLKKKESELRLQIDHGNLPANVFQSLLNTFQRQSTTYGTAKVSYKVPNKKRSVTVKIDAQQGSVIGDLYVDSFDINNINPILDYSAVTIVQHLANLAIQQFITYRTI